MKIISAGEALKHWEGVKLKIHNILYKLQRESVLYIQTDHTESKRHPTKCISTPAQYPTRHYWEYTNYRLHLFPPADKPWSWHPLATARKDRSHLSLGVQFHRAIDQGFRHLMIKTHFDLIAFYQDNKYHRRSNESNYSPHLHKFFQM
jgi:hypothetical protein